MRLVTVSDRAFPVAAAKLWNELPGDVTASQSLAAFRCQLKTFLFVYHIRFYNLQLQFVH